MTAVRFMLLFTSTVVSYLVLKVRAFMLYALNFDNMYL